MENRSYPDVIWWARTQVYPDGVVGVLNRALAVQNIRACHNNVVIDDWWLVIGSSPSKEQLGGIRDPLLLETIVICYKAE